MIPPGTHVIHISAEKVVKWGNTIKILKAEYALLERIVGPRDDPGFSFPGWQGQEEEYDRWGWFIDFDKPQVAGQRVVGFWFRELPHAIYFKTLWGGR